MTLSHHSWMRWVNLPTLTSPTQTGLTPIGERTIWLKKFTLNPNFQPIRFDNWQRFDIWAFVFEISLSLSTFSSRFSFGDELHQLRFNRWLLPYPYRIRPSVETAPSGRWKISTASDWPSRSVESSVELQEYSLAKSSKSTRMPSRKTTGLYSPHPPPKKRSHAKERRMTKFDLFKSCLFLINFLHKISAKKSYKSPMSWDSWTQKKRPISKPKGRCWSATQLSWWAVARSCGEIF